MRQAEFVAALMDPGAAVPAGLTGPGGGPVGRRFDVYRNNVAGGLTRALEAGFPAVRRLVGEEFFAAMAGVFLRTHPPRGRVLMLYGDEFPGFLADFPPVAHLGYLADVARLEQALREAYHAADHVPVALAGMAPERVLRMRLGLAPSARVVRSRWPVRSIWAANLRGGPAPVMQGEDVLVLRAGFDPEPHLLPPGGTAFVAALQAGLPLEAALEAGGEGAGAVLALLLRAGAMVEGRE